jgi:arylsulfatase A-like enzyme
MAKKSRARINPQPAQITNQFSHVWLARSHSWMGLPACSSFLPIVAAAWFVFAALESALNVLIPGSALRNDQLPLGARLLLTCYSLAVLAIFIVAIGGVLMLLARTTRRFIHARTPVRWITNGIGILIAWFILMLYGASWATFWQIGTFLDYHAFAFMAPHPVQVFHWVDADAAIAVIALTLAATVAIIKWMPRWITRWHLMKQRRLVVAWGGAVGLCIVGALLGDLYSGWRERQYTRSGILYAKSHDDAAGPFLHVLADFRRRVWSQPEELAKSDKFQIIQRPIIPMAQYLDSIQHRKINHWNVILLIVESLRADQLRSYGGNRDVMPTADKLAQEGRVFLNTYAQASHTNYATLVPLSSHYPLRSATEHVYPENPPYPRVLIYDVLKALGYSTGIFSSSNEYWAGMINYLQTGNIDRFFHAANFKGPTYIMEGDIGFAGWVRTTKHSGSVDDRFTTDEAIQWIDSLDGGPFFISINFQNSHLPYPVPRDFPRRFGPDKLDFKIRVGFVPRDKIQIVKDIYADSLAYIDSQIARLFQYLKRKGMWERTLIVLTGDHGQAFYEHGFVMHGSQIFNEVMKVPLIVRAPELQPGLETRPAQHVDVPPSILDLLGLPVHPSFQGESLFDSRLDPTRSIYMVAQTPLAFQYGIVRSGYKLIYDKWQQQYSLYDLTTDPEEKNDLAASKPDRVKELAQRLQTWRQLQIDYYADEKLQAREYPPIIAD